MGGRGGIVVLLGADGSGKSTISGLLLRQLDQRRISVRVRHWRPMILPSPRLFVGQKPSSDYGHHHEKREHPLSVSIFLSIYYWADFWLAYLGAMSFIRKGGVVIWERYIYDFLFDPLRHRLKIPEFWARLLCEAAPRPALIVVLTGEPAMFYDRKNELNIAEIKQQQDRITEYTKNRPEVFFIDTTKASAPDAGGAIITQMESRGINAK